MRRFAFATLLAAALLAVPAVAQAPRVRWSAAACHGRTAYAEGKEAHASLFEDGRVQVRVTEAPSDRLVGEATVDGPHWRSRAGVDCAAMGVASAELVTVRGRLAVRVEVSVSDLCERGAPRCAVVPVPAR